MSLSHIVDELRNYEGLKRKRAVGTLIKALEYYTGGREDILASFGEDAAVISLNSEEVLLLAADGIWSRLMKDPEWAGYCAVLVNIHDIAAMGGEPIAMVDVLSISSRTKCYEITTGIRKGIEKFGIPIVGGHLHPDALSDSIDIMIIGKARRDSVIYSSTARPGDLIVVGLDLDGRIHPEFPYNWDSTTMKDREILVSQISAMRELGEKGLVTAGKDVSNPGIIGTVGMLLEVSGTGGIVDLSSVPMPEDMELTHWLKVYPGMGFVVTCRKEMAGDVKNVFRARGITAEVVGEVTSDRRYFLKMGDEKKLFYDFTRESIFGLEGIDGG